MRTATTAVALVFVVLASTVATRAAALAGPRSLEDVAGRVPLIVTGRCTSVQAAWNEKKTLITTTATYEVERVVKGEPVKGSLVVRQLGGSVGSITQAIVGAPRFAVGERSLMFLTSEVSGVFRVYGLDRGKRPIRRDPSSGVDLVRLDAAAGSEPQGRSETVAAREARVGTAGEVPLDALLHALVPGPRAGR